MDELMISGKRFISSRRAAKEYHYHSDYIGQLIRAGKIQGQKVGRSWYVSEASLTAHLRKEAIETQKGRKSTKQIRKFTETDAKANKVSNPQAAVSYAPEPEIIEKIPAPDVVLPIEPAEPKLLTYIPATQDSSSTVESEIPLLRKESTPPSSYRFLQSQQQTQQDFSPEKEDNAGYEPFENNQDFHTAQAYQERGENIEPPAQKIPLRVTRAYLPEPVYQAPIHEIENYYRQEPLAIPEYPNQASESSRMIWVIGILAILSLLAGFLISSAPLLQVMGQNF